MNAETDTEDEHYDSFVTAFATPEFAGEPLRKFSASRRVAANCMGVKYPNIGEDGLDQFQRTGIYPGALKDAICVLWLCTLPDSHELSKEDIRAVRWTPIRAHSKPTDAVEAATEWADRNGIVDMTSPKFQEAFALFISIVSPVEEAKFNVASTGGNTGAASEDDSGNV